MTATPGDRLVATVAVCAAGLALAAALVVAVEVSRARAFQVDEVEHLHAAFNLRRGTELYRDFWQGHNPLLYAVLYPLADPADPVTGFRAARWLSFACLLATAGCAGFCAYRLRGAPAGWLAGGLLLLHSTMVERGIEVRPDGWLALCAVLALAVHMTELSPLRRHVIEGLLLAAAFLFTQKAVVLCAAFRPALAVGGDPPPLARPGRGPDVGLERSHSGDCGVALDARKLGRVPRVQRPVDRTQRRPLRPPGPQLRSLARARRRRAAEHPLRRPRRGVTPVGRPAPRARGAVALLALAGLAYLVVNPFPFPYTHVAVLPFFAILLGCAAITWARGLKRAGGALVPLAVAGVLLGAAATSFPRLIAKTTTGNDYQLQVLREIQRITRPGDAVFDMAGLYARPDAYPVYLMTGALYQSYLAGEFPPMIPTWRERGLVAMIENYRVHWLGPPEFDFLANNMVYWGSNIYVSGAGIRDLRPGTRRASRSSRRTATVSTARAVSWSTVRR
ncbi:MAG: hypothetical protein R2991_14865 [Thermoanaerobaculia bacterium]